MEDKIKISGIVFENEKDDYLLCGGFTLTEEEENAIWKILMNHDTEEYFVRGIWKEIAEEIGE